MNADTHVSSPFLLSLMVANDTPSPVDEVRRARRGDAQAFAALVRGHQRAVYGLCLRLVRSDAEASELAQETFLRAYQHLDRFDESRPFDLWVMAIARNLCLDLLRRRTKHHPEDVEDHALTLASDEPSQEQLAISKQERQSLEEALSTLPIDDREVLVLYYVQKRTTKEIAQIVGVAPGTIMARLFRAREKLRNRMQPQQPKQEVSR